MSIRTRVLSVTLGLAVAGFVVTLDAIDDKVLVVRDGSVDVYVNNSNLDEKSEDRHKWSKKADTVQVFLDETTAAACTTPVKTPVSTPMRFEQVTLKIRDRSSSQPVDVTASNHGFWVFGRMHLRMPLQSQWRFAFRQYGYRLVYGNEPERDLKLEQVEVTTDEGVKTVYPDTPSTSGVLCVVFKH
jgi:hypothetical protein